MHQFVESSPVGEYTVRLNILHAFSVDMWLQGVYILYRYGSCFIAYGSLFPLDNHFLGNILKNSVCYYQQFLPTVLSHTSKLTGAVEKEFKVKKTLYPGELTVYMAAL